MPKTLSEYSPPEYKSTAFNCPYCGAYAKQTWWYILLSEDKKGTSYRIQAISITLKEKNINVYVEVSFCSHCSQPTFWLSDPGMPKIMYPPTRTAPPANDDLDDNIKKIYDEAADIANRSPRASAALLRLCIEELCKQLGEKKDLNTSIGNLVKKGMSTQIQQALDYCRVIGNNAVHDGKIDLEDDPSTISTLFYLVNDIAYEMITKPKEMQERYSSLPDGYKDAVAKRDGKTE